MKLKKKPVKPKREYVKHKVYLRDDGMLVDFIETLKKMAKCDIDLCDIKIEIEYDPTDYGDYNQEICITYSALEDKSLYQKRLSLYVKKLNKYNQWYKENKDVIDEEIKRRKDVLSKRKRSQRTKEIAALKKRLKVLES